MPSVPVKLQCLVTSPSTLYHLAVFISLTYLKEKKSKNSEMPHYPIDHSRYRLTIESNCMNDLAAEKNHCHGPFCQMVCVTPISQQKIVVVAS